MQNYSTSVSIIGGILTFLGPWLLFFEIPFLGLTSYLLGIIFIIFSLISQQIIDTETKKIPFATKLAVTLMSLGLIESSLLGWLGAVISSSMDIVKNPFTAFLITLSLVFTTIVVILSIVLVTFGNKLSKTVFIGLLILNSLLASIFLWKEIVFRLY